MKLITFFFLAILDANSVIRTRPEWSKGSSRLAEALTAAHEWRDATLACKSWLYAFQVFNSTFSLEK